MSGFTDPSMEDVEEMARMVEEVRVRFDVHTSDAIGLVRLAQNRQHLRAMREWRDAADEMDEEEGS